jgi:hypothetical protein
MPDEIEPISSALVDKEEPTKTHEVVDVSEASVEIRKYIEGARSALNEVTEAKTSLTNMLLSVKQR